MKLKRLMASDPAGFDDFARVRVQRARVEAQITRLQRQRADLDTERERWNTRAVALAASDEAKALQCVRRSRQADIRLCAIEAQLSEHLQLADDLTSRLEELEARLSELQLRKNAPSSRSAGGIHWQTNSASWKRPST